MLANNEPIQGIDMAAALRVMLNELPWNALRAYIQTNADLNRLCTAGGHRLDPKHRERICQILVKEAGKAEFSQTFCSGIFAQWYPVHETLHKALEDYFHSEEYKTHREGAGLAEDTYVLPPGVLERFFKPEDIEKWRTLLCFSPLQFTAEQAQKVLSDSAGSVDASRRLREMEQSYDSQVKENARLANEVAGLRRQHEQVSAEATELRLARKNLAAEREALTRKFEQSQADNKRLREQVAEGEAVRQQARTALEEQCRLEVQRLQGEVRRLDTELVSWRTKYEQQRAENRELVRSVEAMTKQLAQEKATVEDKIRDIERLHRFADLVLSKIDWPKVGQQLKLTTTLKRQFNSLIKKLNYEDDRTLTIEGTLVQFWDKLMARERELLNSIAQSNVLEVSQGDVEGYWRGLTDSFEDAHIGLEARVILLRMIQEIFYQVIEMEDLEQPMARPARLQKAP